MIIVSIVAFYSNEFPLFLSFLTEGQTDFFEVGLPDNHKSKKRMHKQTWRVLYNTLLNSDRLIGCLWSRDIE